MEATTTKPDLDLLTLLADKLEVLPPDHFNMSDWWMENADGKDVLVPKPFNWGRYERTVCGFAGCALGHAATMPEFQARGLRLEELSRHDGLVSFTVQLGDGSSCPPRGFYAAGALFGLSVPQALDLFDPSSYSTEPLTSPTVVADRIRKFVAGVRKAVGS